ncbi:MAG: hypothetical protein CL610_23265 [Anaerolineaceae bacterium]|nr:hypothetical protein [Anaerolineaceae bacterium]
MSEQAIMQTRAEIRTGTSLSAEMFRALPESNQIIEHVDGVVIVSPSPTILHQRLVLRTYDLLRQIAPSGEVFTAPLDVYLGDDTVQPDVFWVAEGSACHPTDNDRFAGPPELIVEVLSTSEGRDRVIKFDLYEQHGVQEYWLLGADYVEVYELQQAQLRRMGAFLAGQSFNSPVLGTTIHTDRIFLSAS